jgi:hypothetical protein
LHNVQELEREAFIGVERGLYILRYVSGAQAGVSPVAVVRPAPGSEPCVEVISAPGIVNGFFSCPGECAVVRAERSGRLSVKVMRQSAAESFDASLRLEPISGAERAEAPTARSATGGLAPPVAESLSHPAFKILAHVSRRGDVEVNAGEWIGGPGGPAAIEGLSILGALPSGVHVEMQPLVATDPLRWLDWAPMGSFAGTRRRALSLAGLRLRLVGENASRFTLSADALFLGSPVQSRCGRDIELVGAVGGDPLVGLRLGIAPAETAASQAAVVAGVAVAEQRPDSRIKVFRAASSN